MHGLLREPCQTSLVHVGRSATTFSTSWGTSSVQIVLRLGGQMLLRFPMLKRVVCSIKWEEQWAVMPHVRHWLRLCNGAPRQVHVQAYSLELHG
mmetsp:Transcript_168681/g.536376  ORF Transcript_168681/g.536376 Transcript_168681/m.536376 type:complete len:94 (-) Transcript_168681:871-1152(-)